MPSEPHSTDEDDLADEEVYAFEPGEAESVGTVTLANGTVMGPNMVVDPEGEQNEI